MRGKWLKVAAFIVVVVIALTVALLILAKTLITPERVRSTVVTAAEDYLHRPVDLERIEIGLFSGIACRGLAIGEREGEESFIETEELILRYRFWPLLFGRVVIDEVTLNRPVIRIAREAEGGFNFDDLLGADAGRSGDAPAGEGGQGGENGQGGSSIDLLVSRLNVASGRVEFTDQAVQDDQAVLTRLQAFNLSARDLSLKGAFPLDVDFRLNDAPVTWTGTVDPARKGAEGQLRVEKLAVAPLLVYLGEAIPGKLSSLQLDADLQIDADQQALSSRGTVLLDKIGLTLEALPDAPITDARLKLDHDLTAELERKEVDIRSFRAEYNRILLETGQGRIGFGETPQLDIELRLPQLSAEDLLASLPQALAAQMAELALSGRVEARVHLAGNASSPETLISDGSVILEKAGAQVGHLEPILSGTVALENEGLTARQVQLDVAQNSFLLDLRGQRLFDEIKYFALNIESEAVDLDALLPPENEDAGSSSTKESGTGETKGEPAGPVELPLEIDGKLRIATASYRGLDMKDLQLDWRLADNVLRFENMGAAAASGDLQSRAVIDLGRRGLAYDANVQVKGVDANEIVSAFAPRAADTVFGQLDLSANLNGSGTQPSAVKRNLTGSGQFEIRQGELTGAGIMQSLAAFLDMKDLRVFRFALGEGTFKIRDGVVNLDSSFDGSKARLRPTGRIGLDQSLDLSVRTLLSPENTEKMAGRGTLGEVISDEEGWGLVPLKITGSFADPSVSLDRKAMAEQVRKGAEKKVREKLQEKVLEELGEPTEDAEEEPAEKLLKDMLRGLF